MAGLNFCTSVPSLCSEFRGRLFVFRVWVLTHPGVLLRSRLGVLHDLRQLPCEGSLHAFKRLPCLFIVLCWVERLESCAVSSRQKPSLIHMLDTHFRGSSGPEQSPTRHSTASPTCVGKHHGRHPAAAALSGTFMCGVGVTGRQ